VKARQLFQPAFATRPSSWALINYQKRDARVTHDPRYSGMGPSLTFAISAAPSRSTRNMKTTKSRNLGNMRPSRFPHSIGIDVTSSYALVARWNAGRGAPTRADCQIAHQQGLPPNNFFIVSLASPMGRIQRHGS
jgi:hypothetical protein